MKGIIQDVMSSLSQAEWAKGVCVRYDVCLRAEGNQLHHPLYICRSKPNTSRSQQPRGLRRGTAGSNPAEGKDVCCECCVLSGRGLCDGPIPRPHQSYRVCASECDQVQQ
jgi:hypothetical protein